MLLLFTQISFARVQLSVAERLFLINVAPFVEIMTAPRRSSGTEVKTSEGPVDHETLDALVSVPPSADDDVSS